MLVPLFMTVSLLSHVRLARHRVLPASRQVRGRLGGQTRPLPRSRVPAQNFSSRKFETQAAGSVPPRLFVLMPPQAAPTPTAPPPIVLSQAATALPHPLMPLNPPLKLTLQPPEEQEEEDLIAAINHARTQCGLGTLALDPVLCTAARAHSREMCDQHYFDHQSPTEGQQTPMDRYLAVLRKAGKGRPRQIVLGENILFATHSDGQEEASFAHQSLMASPGHRANILEPRFTKVGVGLYNDPTGQFWVTEMFLLDN